jgi:FlaG/FlaF family flagellin (archaellin)
VKGEIPRDSAVSPVVGIMLMLAVTVMVAAIVSTYAGGFSGNSDKSPQSSLRVTPDLLQHRIYFEHNGGDPFMLSSIQVVLREHDNKTAISFTDAGSDGLARNFSEVGSSGEHDDTTIQAGDTFYLEAAEWSSAGAWMKFGRMNVTRDEKVTWIVVDRESGKTISMGSFCL